MFENVACKTSVINSIIYQWWSGKCYCLLPKYLYLTCTWLKKYLMYLMSSKYSEYLNLYLYLQIWKSTCTWLKYFEKYLTPTLMLTFDPWWPWPWIFKAKFQNRHISGMGDPIDVERKSSGYHCLWPDDVLYCYVNVEMPRFYSEIIIAV